VRISGRHQVTASVQQNYVTDIKPSFCIDDDLVVFIVWMLKGPTPEIDDTAIYIPEAADRSPFGQALKFDYLI
jgi:hypothetical protein